MKLLIRDTWLMAVDKPAGLLSQPGLGPEQSDSLITRLQQLQGDSRMAQCFSNKATTCSGGRA